MGTESEITVGFIGNPNCGKTTLFNVFTGANLKVANWPGVTVEKKEGKLKSNKEITIMDLPGIYSLSPYTLEEVVARNYLIQERPDAILNLVDGTNIERNLYLSTQLMELGIPVVIAINMIDVLEKSGARIDIHQLSKRLGCEVVEISALKGTGIQKAVDSVIEAAKKDAKVPIYQFAEKVETAIEKVSNQLPTNIKEVQKRFFAIKLLERDDKIGGQMSAVPDVEGIVTALEEALDDDSESIITNERYRFITSIIGKCFKKAERVSLATGIFCEKFLQGYGGGILRPGCSGEEDP